jgi:hypothetical protein
MNACIFIMAINVMTPVFAADHATQVAQLNINDRVCVTQIEDGWATIHWSNGNVGHTGYLAQFKAEMPGQATEPTQREEQYDAPPPAPRLPDPPLAPPTPQNHSDYRTPTLPDTLTRPAVLAMECFPEHSQPYVVVYVNGNSAIGTKTGKAHEHAVLEENDNQRNHVFYVKAEGNGGHTLFYAFDYSQRGSDVSAIRVMGPGYDAKDKCLMDWATMREAIK